MPRMRLCANCGTKYPVAAARCPECDTHAEKDDDKPKVDSSCPYNDHGVRCGAYGTLSPSTNGSGPWYCRDHAWVFLNDRGPSKSSATEGRAALSKQFPVMRAWSIEREPGADEGE